MGQLSSQSCEEVAKPDRLRSAPDFRGLARLLASPATWGFTILGVPYWGPDYKGLLLFGGYMKGPVVS